MSKVGPTIKATRWRIDKLAVIVGRYPEKLPMFPEEMVALQQELAAINWEPPTNLNGFEFIGVQLVPRPVSSP